MSKERLEEASQWLVSMYEVLSSKTEVEDIEFLQKRIDLFNWMIEQINRLYGGETFKGYKEMYEYNERIKNNALERVRELEQLCTQLIGEEWMNDEGLYESEMMKLEQRNKRYREALEEIECANYWDYGEEYMHQNLQSIACKALEESE